MMSLELLKWHPVSAGVPYDKVVLWWTESGHVFQDVIYDFSENDLKGFLAGRPSSGPVTHWADIQGPQAGNDEALYVVLHEAECIDVTPYIFTDEKKAIDFALNSAAEYCDHPEDYDMRVHDRSDGGLMLSVCYSDDGDQFVVWEKKIETGGQS